MKLSWRLISKRYSLEEHQVFKNENMMNILNIMSEAWSNLCILSTNPSWFKGKCIQYYLNTVKRIGKYFEKNSQFITTRKLFTANRWECVLHKKMVASNNYFCSFLYLLSSLHGFRKEDRNYLLNTADTWPPQWSVYQIMWIQYLLCISIPIHRKHKNHFWIIWNLIQK